MMTDRIGQQLGNYRLIHFLGQGGFADVYLGEHIYLKTQAALKVLRIQLANDALQDFLKEAQTITRLEHPHIVRVLEYGVEGHTPFLVMNYAPNGTLRQRHPRGSRLSPEEVLPYVQQIASALDYAHQQGLIHRDIKPENLLLKSNHEVLLADFGLAVIMLSMRSHHTTQGTAGTFFYMAPEQFDNKVYPASDQYALGIIVYEWLSGERPFQGQPQEIAGQHVIKPPPRLYGKIPRISLDVEKVVFKALEKDPHKRFATVQTFASQFEQACNKGKRPASTAHLTPIPSGRVSQFTPSNVPTKPVLSIHEYEYTDGLVSAFHFHNHPIESISTFYRDTFPMEPVVTTSTHCQPIKPVGTAHRHEYSIAGHAADPYDYPAESTFTANGRGFTTR